MLFALVMICGAFWDSFISLLGQRDKVRAGFAPYSCYRPLRMYLPIFSIDFVLAILLGPFICTSNKI